jgi:hypothetical protein
MKSIYYKAKGKSEILVYTSQRKRNGRMKNETLTIHELTVVEMNNEKSEIPSWLDSILCLKSELERNA